MTSVCPFLWQKEERAGRKGAGKTSNFYQEEETMTRQQLVKFVPMAVMVAFLSYGCAQNTATPPTAAKPAVEETKKQEETVYKGKVVGKSNKAKTISIAVGAEPNEKTIMLKFDDQTQGLEHVKQDNAAMITWEQRGDDKFATVIKPKLAKLPEGVTEIKTDELYDLIQAGTAMTLVDARPSVRYDQAHIPGSINIPVPKLKEKKAEVLPDDKDKLLVFYCGGPT